MSKFNFHYPVFVRYGDLDPQWHVNNAKFQTYFEAARLQYLLKLGLFDGKNFYNLPLIVADVHVRFLAPIEATYEQVMVSMGVTRIGNKSMLMEYELTTPDGELTFATAETVMVGFDYNTKSSIAISPEIRKCIGSFEGKEF